ncbi:energy transducer TonB [Parapusillimonas granuli]|uniref:TonB family protein n=1 Tax=Parapusillimonas granuli TaxID=380911 RepID=A0A853G474_9BURK|nr:TonB family protein [Parapusillimonas granuli]MBB5215826.1 protein TonB [Parapusillimonas granuli]NYT51109.1 TonB family protein [Parapusillimonas granuli]
MTTLFALPELRAPRNDYLRIAFVLSLAIHAAVLSLHFSPPPAPPDPAERPLEVTLVNARSEVAPLQAQALAQDDLMGGGYAQEKLASSPLPRTSTETADEVVLAALRQRQRELEAEQLRLYTALTSPDHVPAQRDTGVSSDATGEDGPDEQEQESLILNAQISALKERIERYNSQPRLQFTGPTTRSVNYAEYVEAWRKKIELLGTEHYPDEARGKVYGSLQLTVYIRKDGSLDRIEIDRPSSHAILNLAASRIVQLAAPFAPLPPAIARETDILAITRTWNFINQTLETEIP